MRLFVALRILANAREKIWQTLLAKIPKKNFKAVEPENVHITLCFIGEAKEENLQRIKSALAKIEFRKFEARLSEIGAFDERVIWIGLTEGAKECEELSRKIREALGIHDERFSAHATLARNRNATGAEFNRVLEELKKTNFSQEFEAKGFTLMQSKLSSGGPSYEEISEFPASTFFSK